MSVNKMEGINFNEMSQEVNEMREDNYCCVCGVKIVDKGIRIPSSLTIDNISDFTMNVMEEIYSALEIKYGDLEWTISEEYICYGYDYFDISPVLSGCGGVFRLQILVYGAYGEKVGQFGFAGVLHEGDAVQLWIEPEECEVNFGIVYLFEDCPEEFVRLIFDKAVEGSNKYFSNYIQLAS